MTALHSVSRLCKIIGGLITAMTHVNLSRKLGASEAVIPAVVTLREKLPQSVFSTANTMNYAIKCLCITYSSKKTSDLITIGVLGHGDASRLFRSETGAYKAHRISCFLANNITFSIESCQNAYFLDPVVHFDDAWTHAPEFSSQVSGIDSASHSQMPNTCWPRVLPLVLLIRQNPTQSFGLE